MTLRPSLWASARVSGARLRQNGDHTAQPAALASRGTDPPWALRSSPPSHGDGWAAVRPTVSKLLLSIDRHPVPISGASRRAAIRPRQSNDWMVLRASALPLRIAATA